MHKSIDCLCDIVSGRESWRIKVCVFRMWEVSNFFKLDKANSVEMVLIDEKVCPLFILLSVLFLIL